MFEDKVRRLSEGASRGQKGWGGGWKAQESKGNGGWGRKRSGGWAEKDGEQGLGRAEGSGPGVVELTSREALEKDVITEAESRVGIRIMQGYCSGSLLSRLSLAPDPNTSANDVIITEPAPGDKERGRGGPVSWASLHPPQHPPPPPRPQHPPAPDPVLLRRGGLSSF